MKKEEIYNIIMTSFRCNNCNRQLFKGKIRQDYHIEAFCPRCKTITVFERQSIAKSEK
jgi:phage FluMu protein Com